MKLMLNRRNKSKTEQQFRMNIRCDLFYNGFLFLLSDTCVQLDQKFADTVKDYLDRKLKTQQRYQSFHDALRDCNGLYLAPRLWYHESNL